MNKGFTSFRASDHSLQDGDYIRVMYTTALGADLGGSWSNTNTTLKALNVKGGTLSPASFTSGVTDYVLQITESDATVTVSYEPTNKNYQARMYLNNYNNENSRYASGSRDVYKRQLLGGRCKRCASSDDFCKIHPCLQRGSVQCRHLR